MMVAHILWPPYGYCDTMLLICVLIWHAVCVQANVVLARWNVTFTDASIIVLLSRLCCLVADYALL